MRKFTSVLCGVISLVAMAQGPVTEFDLTKVTELGGAPKQSVISTVDGSDVTPVSTVAPSPKYAPSRRAPGDGVEMYVVAQTFHKNYKFTYTDGDFTTYNINVKREGDQVTISHLFNLDAKATEWQPIQDMDVVGRYDAAANTITIPVSSVLSNATIAGKWDPYYYYVLTAGTVTEAGKMVPDDNLVFNVVGDFEALTTNQHFGVVSYSQDNGQAYQASVIYRGYYATIPTDEPQLVSFNNQFNLGEYYIGLTSKCRYTVVNPTRSEVDYAVSIDCDGDAFSANPQMGTVAPYGTQDIEFTFCPPDLGEFEGVVTIAYDGIKTTPAPISVYLVGQGIPTPDYSEIVKGGEFKFETNIEFPFEMTTLKDKRRVARSTVNGRWGSSQLTARFTIPEGKTGTVKWKGETANPEVWYYNAGGLYVDDLETPYQVIQKQGTFPIDGEAKLPAGEHFVRFQYDVNQATNNNACGLFVSDLELVLEDIISNEAEIITSYLDFGNFLTDVEGDAKGEGVIVLRNKGSQELKVNSVASDNDVFTVTVPSATAQLLEKLEVPVMLNTREVGEHIANITIETTAGTFQATVRAFIRKMDDFSTIITKGKELVTKISTNADHPFILKDGVAYNSTSGEADTQATESWLKYEFDVPEGKAVNISWEGHIYGSIPNIQEIWESDHGEVDFDHPMTHGTRLVFGVDQEAGSAETFDADAMWKEYLVCTPGHHSFLFRYKKNGDGIISEKDRYEIRSIAFNLVAFNEKGVEAVTPEVVFDKTYVGPNRYKLVEVEILNTGSSNMELINEVKNDGPFTAYLPKNWSPVSFNRTQTVFIKFEPQYEGKFEGDVVFRTTSGDVTIHCVGETYSSEGLLLIGDIEDGGVNWTHHDANNDNRSWELGTNLWGEQPSWVSSGVECFASVSYDIETGSLTPDNWLFTPGIIIPQNGATLDWVAASHSHKQYAEHYSVYVCTPEQIRNPNNLSMLKPIFDETLTVESADEWMKREFDLSEYAGETVHIAFRHHDCNGQYVLKIDDVFVRVKKGNSGVNATMLPVEKVYYNINGECSSRPFEGLNLVRTTYTDGTVKTAKVMVK